MARRLTPWAVVVVVGALLMGILPTAQAQSGVSASEAIPIGTDGKFAGTTAASQSLWYKFNYVGNNSPATVTVTFEPPDSTRLDIFIFTGDPSNPHQEATTSTLSGNVRTIQFTDPGSTRVVFIKVENDHPDRSVSFVGNVTPVATIATPTATSASNPATPQSTPTAGPVASNASQAITLATSGEFSGTLSPRQAVWYRFYYGNPGADANISISIAPNADGADLNVYTGTDPTNLGPAQGGAQVRTGQTISRHVNLPNAQFVFFSLGNNNDAQVLAYGGFVSPFVAPPATPTPTAGATSTATAGPTTTPQPVASAPALAHDVRYFNETRFRIDDDNIYSYFQARGMVESFGFPVSRTFTFLGCSVQVFQRQIAQRCGNNVALMNVLDPEIFPYTRVNGSVFPAADDALKNSTPPVNAANYATAILDFVRANAPDNFQGQPVNFGLTFFNTVSPQQAGTTDPNLIGLFDLEIWGAPISRPAPDPGNSNFIYQRFQRGIMHYAGSQGTRGILLADYVKQIMIGPNLPRNAGANPNLPLDLQQQATGTRFFAQYCPGGTRWLCRPNEMPDSDLTFAFEAG
ncbi:MAG TPA: hypothetical protein VGL99_29685 [Chloroflexota bacterium]